MFFCKNKVLTFNFSRRAASVVLGEFPRLFQLSGKCVRFVDEAQPFVFIKTLHSHLAQLSHLCNSEKETIFCQKIFVQIIGRLSSRAQHKYICYLSPEQDHKVSGCGIRNSNIHDTKDYFKSHFIIYSNAQLESQKSNTSGSQTQPYTITEPLLETMSQLKTVC